MREIKDLKMVKEVTKEWVKYYNSKRLQQTLGYKTPDEVYYGIEKLETLQKDVKMWLKNGDHLTASVRNISCFFS